MTTRCHFKELLYSLLEAWHILKVVAFWDFSPLCGRQWSPFVGLESCVRDYVASLYLEFQPHPQPPLPTRLLEKSEYIWKMLNLCAPLSRYKKNV